MRKIWAKSLTEKTFWYYKRKVEAHPSSKWGALDLEGKTDKGNTMEPLQGIALFKGQLHSGDPKFGLRKMFT